MESVLAIKVFQLSSFLRAHHASWAAWCLCAGLGVAPFVVINNRLWTSSRFSLIFRVALPQAVLIAPKCVVCVALIEIFMLLYISKIPLCMPEFPPVFASKECKAGYWLALQALLAGLSSEQLILESGFGKYISELTKGYTCVAFHIKYSFTS